MTLTVLSESPTPVARPAAVAVSPRCAASFASAANFFARSASTALSSGFVTPESETPTPGFVMFTAASPMTSAKVVTISK